MATVYATQQVGVLDGTLVPAAKADGRQVGAHKRTILASKPIGTALNSGDVFVLGKKRKGEIITGIRCCTDTSFGTSTISVGVSGTAAKYVNAKTLTATDVPTALGPIASTLDDGPATAEETLIATIGVANIGAAVIATFEIDLCGA